MAGPILPPFPAAGTADRGDPIDHACRFRRSASAYLRRTPAGAGNRRTFTYALWMKVSGLSLGAGSSLRGLFGADDGASGSAYANGVMLGHTTNADKLRVFSGLSAPDYTPARRFRDTTSWYHLVFVFDTTQATATDRFKLYVNGVLETEYTARSDPSQNYEYAKFNNAVEHQIGFPGLASAYAGYSFDGYMAEFYFVDGLALGPENFGRFSSSHPGMWVPKRYAGSLGTNGYHLDFANAADLGNDAAGANDFTEEVVSSGDQVADTPSANWAVASAIDKGSNVALTDGALTIAQSASSNYAGTRASIAMPAGSGKWYAECKVSGDVGGAFGISPTRLNEHFTNAGTPGSANAGVILNNGAGARITQRNNANTNSRSADAANDVWQVAYDTATQQLWLGRNDTWYGGGDPAAGTSPTYSGFAAEDMSVVAYKSSNSGGTFTLNFGQVAFGYTPPAGFQPLCAANLPAPGVAVPGDYAAAVTYTGTGATRSVTGAGFLPDLVWIKNRSQADGHKWVDSARGLNGGASYEALMSSSTAAEANDSGGVTSLDADGFSLGAGANGYNDSGENFVAWMLRKAAGFFDIVTYTGTGANRTVAHGLGAVPEMIAVKRRDSTGNWAVYHAGNTAAPETDYLLLNSQNGTADDNTVWNDAAPTSSVFSLGTATDVNANGGSYVAYLFASVPGLCRAGAYVGNGNADGPVVYCGFRPRMVLIKTASTGSSSWQMIDRSRDPINVATRYVSANSTSAESTLDWLDFLATGFKHRSTEASANGNGTSYVYIAFAEIPLGGVDTPVAAAI